MDDNVANRITIARIFLAPVFIVLIMLPLPFREFWAALVFVFASITDGLDGYLARKNKTVTTVGKFLDPLADKLLVSAALITLAWMKQIGPMVVFIIISREFAVTGLRVIAAGEGKVIAASKLGKAKTLTQIIAITAITINAGMGSETSWLHYIFGFLPVQFIADASLVIAVIMTVISGVDYFRKNIKVIIKKG